MTAIRLRLNGADLVINSGGLLEIDVTRAGDETTLARVVKLVQDAQERRAPVERLADRAAKYFLPALLLAGCGGGGKHAAAAVRATTTTTKPPPPIAKLTVNARTIDPMPRSLASSRPSRHR